MRIGRYDELTLKRGYINHAMMTYDLDVKKLQCKIVVPLKSIERTISKEVTENLNISLVITLYNDILFVLQIERTFRNSKNETTLQEYDYIIFEPTRSDLRCQHPFVYEVDFDRDNYAEET